MVNRRYNEWERDTEVYTPNQVESIASYCGIEVVSETYTHLLAYCPFHHNTDSPAFALDKTKGLWTCFNPACDNAGTLPQLLGRLKGHNIHEATRVILQYKHYTERSVADRLAAIMDKQPEFVEFPSEPVNRMTKQFWEVDRGREYMHGRGFTDDTLRYFDIGYSEKQDMVIVPMHDPNGMLVGFVGRSVEGKVFNNSPKLPKSLVPWNFHRAKTHGETVVVVEASFDAMRVHQAGYPNVIAMLGGHFSPAHAHLINRTFSEIIIMTDFDKRENPKPNCGKCAHRKPIQGVRCIGHRPGRELGREIVTALPNKRIRWAAYDDDCVYPHGAKDAGDMTEEEIRAVLRGSLSHFAYTQWGIEDVDLDLAS